MAGHVLAGVGEAFGLHAVDLLVGEPVVGDDLQGSAAAGAALGRGDAEDAVGVGEELDLDLGKPGGHGGQAAEVELGEFAAVGGHFALALEDGEADGGLAVLAGAEELAAGPGVCCS